MVLSYIVGFLRVGSLRQHLLTFRRRFGKKLRIGDTDNG